MNFESIVKKKQKDCYIVPVASLFFLSLIFPYVDIN